jgi:maltooligosyltrehalose synthase
MLKLLDPYRWLIAGVLVASLIAAFFWYRHSLIQEGVERNKIEVAKAVEKQKKRAEAQTANMEEVKNEAIAIAEKEAKRNAAAAASARSELDRLRKQSGSSIDIAKTSHATCVNYAIASTAVLEECGSALVEMAVTADGHVADLNATRGSWPAWDKFAGEMTDFKTRLQAFNSKGQ